MKLWILAAFTVALAGCLVDSTSRGGDAATDPFLSEAPPLQGACCGRDTCVEGNYDTCTFAIGGLWTAGTCAAVDCAVLTGAAVPVNGIGEGGDDDDDDDEESLCEEIFICIEDECGFEDDACINDCAEEADEGLIVALDGLIRCATNSGCQDLDCIETRCEEQFFETEEACEDEGDDDEEGPEGACCFREEGICEGFFPEDDCIEEGGNFTEEATCSEACPDLRELTDADFEEGACCFGGDECEVIERIDCDEEGGDFTEGASCSAACL